MPRSVRRQSGRAKVRGRLEFQKDKIAIVETNVDDATGEILGHTVERLLEEGAFDATVNTFLGKKGRVGHTVRVTCSPNSVGRIAEVLVEETGTLGVKTTEYTRFIVPRKIYSVPVSIRSFNGSVNVKVSEMDGVRRIKPESSEAMMISKSQNLPLREVLELITAAARKHLEG